MDIAWGPKERSLNFIDTDITKYLRFMSIREYRTIAARKEFGVRLGDEDYDRGFVIANDFGSKLSGTIGGYVYRVFTPCGDLTIYERYIIDNYFPHWEVVTK